MLKSLFKKKTGGETLPFSAYSGDGPYTFVSYSHADSAEVYNIIHALHGRGVLMWY